MRIRSITFMILLSASVALGNQSVHGDLVVFSSDFNSGVPTEISGGSTTQGVSGYAGLGPAGNQFGGLFLRNEQVGVDLKKATLTLVNLPTHTAIDIDFLFATIDSWDGVNSPAGPDRFNVTVDGATIFSEVFENSNSGIQTYSPPPGVELARRQELGFTVGTSFYGDSAYNMGLDPAFTNIAHSSDSVTIEWFTSDLSTWQGFTDESWAIDNLSVTLTGVPEPSSIGMFGLVCLLGLRRRKQKSSGK